LAPPVGPQIKIVATVYDLNYLVAPSTMAYGALVSHRLFFKSSLKRAAAISTISQGTARRISQFFGLDTAAIAKPAVSRSFYPRPVGEVHACLGRYGITQPYFLAVATREPRKNLELLVRTFLAMKHDGLLPHHRLVLVGKEGWKHRRLDRL